MKRAWVPPSIAITLFLIASLFLHLMEAEAYRWLAGWIIGLSSIDYFRAVTGHPSSWRVRVMYSIPVAAGLVFGLIRMPWWVRPEWVSVFMSTDPLTSLRVALPPAIVLVSVVALVAQVTTAELRRVLDSQDDPWDYLAVKQMPDGKRWTIWTRPVVSWIGVPAALKLAFVTFMSGLSRPVRRIPPVLLFWFTLSLGVVLFEIGGLCTYLAYELGSWWWGATGLIAETIIVGTVVALSAELGQLIRRGVRQRNVMLLPAIALVAVVGVVRYSVGWFPEDGDFGQSYWYLFSAIRGALPCGYVAMLLWAVVGVEDSAGERRTLPVGLEWATLAAPIGAIITALAYSGATLWSRATTITLAYAVVLAVTLALLFGAPRAEYTRRRASVVWIGAGSCVLTLAYIEVVVMASAGSMEMARLAVLYLGVWAILGSEATFGSYLTAREAVNLRTLWRRARPWIIAGLAVGGASFALALWSSARPYSDTVLIGWLRFAASLVLASTPVMLVAGVSLIQWSARLSQRAVERPVA